MNHRPLFRTTVLLGLSAIWMAQASAQGGMGHGSMGSSGGMGAAGAAGMSAGMARSDGKGMASAQSGNQAMTEGEVRKVDPQAQTLTLRHADIPNLNMPGMTMMFKAQSPALLGKVKAGDKVRFHAEMPGGILTVTAIDVVK